MSSMNLNMGISMIELSIIEHFLVTCTWLHKPLWRLVGLSDGPSVGRSIAECENKPNWHNKTIWAMETISNDTTSARCRVQKVAKYKMRKEQSVAPPLAAYDAFPMNCAKASFGSSMKYNLPHRSNFWILISVLRYCSKTKTTTTTTKTTFFFIS